MKRIPRAIFSVIVLGAAVAMIIIGVRSAYQIGKRDAVRSHKTELAQPTP